MAVQKSLLTFAVLAVLIVSASGSPSSNKTVTVNLMVDYDVPLHPTEEQLNEAHKLFVPIINEINGRGLKATIFTTSDLTTSIERLYLSNVGRSQNIELAINGNNTGELLASKPYSEQKTLLENAKKWLDSAHYCGINTIDARGFKPQSFSQNEDTFRVLDEMGMVYDAGFKAGILYLPGHRNDTWPYLAEGHKFYVVPISSIELPGERAYMSDSFAKEEKKLSGGAWEKLLINKFDEAAKNGEPMVVSISVNTSGSGGYLDALRSFLDYATSKNASFVTTMDLVNISKGEDLNDLAAGMALNPADNKSGCSECNKARNISLNITLSNTTGNDTGTIRLVRFEAKPS